jgi:hypothetical protein
LKQQQQQQQHIDMLSSPYFRYHRCQFELPLLPASGSCPQQFSYAASEAMTVTAFSRWEDIAEKALRPSDKPVVLNRY